MQKGGIYMITASKDSALIHNDINSALDWYIDNSDVQLIPIESVYGFIFELILDTIAYPINPFRKFLDDTPVTSILVKIVITTEDDFYDEESIPETTKVYTLKKDFLREVKMQRYIYDLSNTNGYPICPAILASYIISDNLLISKLKSKSNPTNTKLHDTLDLLFKLDDLGIIFMEFANGYETVHSFNNKLSHNDKQWMMKLVNFEAVRLAGYNFAHGDLHQGNILYNPNVQYLDKMPPGRVFIIDFGKTMTRDNRAINSNISKLLLSHLISHFDHKPYQWLRSPEIDIHEYNRMASLKFKDPTKLQKKDNYIANALMALPIQEYHTWPVPTTLVIDAMVLKAQAKELEKEHKP